MKQGLVRLLYNGKRFMGGTLHMIMCVLLCYPVSIRIYYQQGVLFLVFLIKMHKGITCENEFETISKKFLFLEIFLIFGFFSIKLLIYQENSWKKNILKIRVLSIKDICIW